MTGPLDNNLNGVEAGVENRGGSYVDIHCHCIPGVDDGPGTMAGALALCQGLVDDGIGTVIATPHQLGRFDGSNEAERIRQDVRVLNEELKSNGIALTVMAGGDVRVDERMCQLYKDDKVLTLADGGKYILLEFPHNVFIDIRSLLSELSSLGISSIISHPERHLGLLKQPEILQGWLEYSTYLQVTASSLLGEFGSTAQEAAWRFLSSGQASFVATDAHNLSERKPRMSRAFESIRARLGERIARLVCIDNPSRVLNGEEILTTGVVISGHKHERGTKNGRKSGDY